jgi:uncharacterized membrane protein HdeD (DUF308 family)
MKKARKQGNVYIIPCAKYHMPTVSLVISAGLAIILGIVILIFPKLLRWAVGLYLIVFGILQLLGQTLAFSP